jgi:hypothetical protein
VPHNTFENFFCPDPLLRARHNGARGIDPDDVLNIRFHALRLGARQIDLVDDRKNFQIVIEGHVDIRHGLGLDALRGIHYE